MEYAVDAPRSQNSPEIAQTDALAASRAARGDRGRSVRICCRTSRWCRTARRSLSKSGVGSETLPGGPNDEAWSVSVQATSASRSPGRRRAAELSQAKHNLREMEAQRDGRHGRQSRHEHASRFIERPAPILRSTFRSRPPLPRTRISRMVTDAYARGVVSVTELIDAQETALSSGPRGGRCEVHVPHRLRRGAALDERVRDPAGSGFARSLVSPRGRVVPHPRSPTPNGRSHEGAIMLQSVALFWSPSRLRAHRGTAARRRQRRRSSRVLCARILVTGGAQGEASHLHGRNPLALRDGPRASRWEARSWIAPSMWART